MEGRIQKVCLSGIRTVARAASRTHFYSSGIWVNVPKGRYNAFFREQCERRSKFESRNLIPLTRDWTTCDLLGQGNEWGEVVISKRKTNDSYYI